MRIPLYQSCNQKCLLVPVANRGKSNYLFFLHTYARLQRAQRHMLGYQCASLLCGSVADEVDTLVPLALRVIGPAEDDCTSHLLRARNRTGPVHWRLSVSPVLCRHRRSTTQGTRAATQGNRELPVQCPHCHSHTNRTLDSLNSADRPPNPSQ